MKPVTWVFLLALLAPAAAAGQASFGLTAGAVHPGSDLYDLRDAAGGGRIAKGNALGLGAFVEFSFLRVGLAYATGATIEEHGVANPDEIGEGTLLAVSGDLVLRPIPRIIGIQPYGIAGLALKHEGYSWDDDGFSDALPSDETDGALHIGIGADFMFGKFGIMAEVSDYITRDDDVFGRHDSFFMIGLRFGGR